MCLENQIKTYFGYTGFQFILKIDLNNTINAIDLLSAKQSL